MHSLRAKRGRGTQWASQLSETSCGAKASDGVEVDEYGDMDIMAKVAVVEEPVPEMCTYVDEGANIHDVIGETPLLDPTGGELSLFSTITPSCPIVPSLMAGLIAAGAPVNLDMLVEAA